MVFLQGPGEQLRGAGGVAVNQHDQWGVDSVGAAARFERAIVSLYLALSRNDDAVRQELFGHLNGYAERAAGVATQIQNQGPHAAIALEPQNGFFKLVNGGLLEADELNVADPFFGGAIFPFQHAVEDAL